MGRVDFCSRHLGRVEIFKKRHHRGYTVSTPKVKTEAESQAARSTSRSRRKVIIGYNMSFRATRILDPKTDKYSALVKLVQ